MWRKQGRALSMFPTDPTAMIANIKQAVMSTISHPVSAALLADGYTTTSTQTVSATALNTTSKTQKTAMVSWQIVME